MTTTRTDTAATPPLASNPRALAAHVLAQVLTHGRYLDVVLDEALQPATPEPALVQELAYGVLRWFHQLAGIATRLVERPLKLKDQDIHALLLAGLYQLRALRVATHAAVDETVAASEALGKPWAKGLLNACLRTYLRRQQEFDSLVKQDPALRLSHPTWLLKEFRAAYPTEWEHIAQANNERPPLTLRINSRVCTRAAYVDRLRAAGLAVHDKHQLDSDITLTTPVPVARLPGFTDGAVSVQDAAAQWSAVLLDAQPGHRVLDACAAPGGKAAHLLERVPELAELVAVDREPTRVARIHDNLVRLGLTARVICADATDPSSWWRGAERFDRVLLDAPCSATGVIRRHPDVKLHRQPADLPKLAAIQRKLLHSLWPLLAPGGKLLYVTCSILPEENENTVRAFLATTQDAVEGALPAAFGRARSTGRQTLPGENGTDGFYYACLHKK